jgi:hypothetical protein
LANKEISESLRKNVDSNIKKIESNTIWVSENRDEIAEFLESVSKRTLLFTYLNRKILFFYLCTKFWLKNLSRRSKFPSTQRPKACFV